MDVTALIEASESQRQRGSSVMYLAREGQLLGLLAVSDPIKASTPEAVASLHDAGIRVVMATGDGLDDRALGRSSPGHRRSPW